MSAIGDNNVIMMYTTQYYLTGAIESLHVIVVIQCLQYQDTR